MAFDVPVLNPVLLLHNTDCVEGAALLVLATLVLLEAGVGFCCSSADSRFCMKALKACNGSVEAVGSVVALALVPVVEPTLFIKA